MEENKIANKIIHEKFLRLEGYMSSEWEKRTKLTVVREPLLAALFVVQGGQWGL